MCETIEDARGESAGQEKRNWFREEQDASDVPSLAGALPLIFQQRVYVTHVQVLLTTTAARQRSRSLAISLTLPGCQAGVGVVFRAAKNGSGDLRVVAMAPDGPARESGQHAFTCPQCGEPQSTQQSLKGPT